MQVSTNGVVPYPFPYIHRSYVTPVELGRAWLHREVLQSTAIDLGRTCWRVIRESIDEALVVEWQRHWRLANTGRTLFALLDRGCLRKRAATDGWRWSLLHAI